MRTAELPTIGTLDTTLPSAGDPTYQTESLCLTIHKIIKELSDEGFEFQQAQTTDFSTYGTNTQDAVDDYIERFEDLLETGTTAVSAALPDVLPIIGALLSGGSAPVLAILAQGVLDTMLRHWDRRADIANGDPTKADMAGVVAELQSIDAKLETTEEVSLANTLDVLMEDIRAQIETTLNEFTINLHSDEFAAYWGVEPPS